MELTQLKFLLRIDKFQQYSLTKITHILEILIISKKVVSLIWLVSIVSVTYNKADNH